VKKKRKSSATAKRKQGGPFTFNEGREKIRQTLTRKEKTWGNAYQKRGRGAKNSNVWNPAADGEIQTKRRREKRRSGGRTGKWKVKL